LVAAAGEVEKQGRGARVCQGRTRKEDAEENFGRFLENRGV